MQAHTKKHHTKLRTLRFEHRGHIYNIPKNVADKYEDKSANVSAKDLFSDLEQKFTKAGVMLRGTRYRAGLTQVEMAKKIKVTQADLSKMENGKRPIGKIIAKRIEKAFGTNYRYFLG